MSTSSSLWRCSLADFQHAVETRSTPGCGAAAALSACLGLSLILKGVRLSGSDNDPEKRDLLVRGDELHRTLAAAVDDDAEAFTAWLEAGRLPETTDAEHRHRAGALARARAAAVRIPLDAAERCHDVLTLALEAIGPTAPALKSDTLSGAAMVRAALEALLIGVEANLDACPDPRERDAIEARCRDLRETAEQRCQRLGI